MKAKWLGAALVFAAIGGCDTTNTYVTAVPDMAGASPAPACPPNAKECVSSTLARVCPADGSGWLAVQCSFGETCSGGDCALDLNTVPCSSADNFCVSDTAALLCNGNGMGFTMKSCPANTNCVGAGDCAGSCLVGSTFCLDIKTELVCNDGLTLTPSPCPSGQACSDTVGACAPAACTPNNCAAECGNKAVDPNNTDPAFFSFCQDSPFGWQWASVACSAPQTCSPTAACNASSFSDACTSECVGNEIRCSDDGTGTQTCDPATGKFGPVVACIAPQICVSDANGIALGCGDLLCDAGAPGYCVVDAGVSKLRGCTNGKLDPIDRLTTCNPGTCITDPNGTPDPILGVIPGACGVQCQTGDQMCVGFGNAGDGSSIIGCGPNGLWSTTSTSCDTADPNSGCFAFKSLDGRPRAICGVCAPGDTRCSGSTGNPSPNPIANPTDFMQTCGPTGQWGTATACVASHCENTGAFPASYCFANCIPGKLMCLGVQAGGADPVDFGTTQQGTCTGDGRPDPTPSPCPVTTTSCRTGPNRTNAYGCVVCVGSQNEAGQPDTRCNGTQVQVCNATNNGYTNQMACVAPAGTCVGEDDPTTASPASCSFADTDCFLGSGCCDFFGEGPIVSCGSTPNCCAVDCSPPVVPAPAHCE
jgi:hypothetical protein